MTRPSPQDAAQGGVGPSVGGEGGEGGGGVPVPSERDVFALADAMHTMLLDMDGCIRAPIAYEALCRRAYEPFRAMMGDDGSEIMALETALQICLEAQV